MHRGDLKRVQVQKIHTERAVYVTCIKIRILHPAEQLDKPSILKEQYLFWQSFEAKGY